MTGHMGDETVTTQNLDIVRVDEVRSLLLVRGAVLVPRTARGRAAPSRPARARELSMQLELLNEQGQATSKVDAPDTSSPATTTNTGAPDRGGLPGNARQGTVRNWTAAKSSTRPRSRSARRAPARTRRHDLIAVVAWGRPHLPEPADENFSQKSTRRCTAPAWPPSCRSWP